MRLPEESRWRFRWENCAALGALGVLLLLLTATFQLSLFKYYSIDEFMHSHAAWLVSRGSIPFRDFCDFHFPLLYQILAIPWCFMEDDPGNILFLRLSILPFVGLILAGVAVVNRRRGLLAMLAAPAFLLSMVPFAIRATEIRHDTVAFSLFLCGLGVLTTRGSSDSVRGAFFGALVGISVWGSQKVFLYGAPLAIVFLVDAVRTKITAERSLFGSLRAVLAGGALLMFAIGVYLTATRSWSAFVEYALGWAFQWQAEYAGFSWRQSFTPWAGGWFWPLVLAVAGVFRTARDLVRTGVRAWSDPDILLVLLLGSSFLYFQGLAAPYEYNLIPFFGFISVFAARGLADVARSVESACVRGGLSPDGITLLVVGLALVPPAMSFPRLEAYVDQNNAYQHAVLSQIRDLTSPSDVAYDNSGSYVARPSASFYFYTDAPMRARLGEMLAREIPKSIVRHGSVLFVNDARFPMLPVDLRRFVADHFQPFSADLWLWGQTYRAGAEGRLSSEFLAVRKDRYFVEPASAATSGRLRIDGREITSPVFELEPGIRRVEFDGEPAAGFAILWLPRTGEMWTPRPGLKPRFSRIL